MRPSRMRLNSLLGTVDPLQHRRALLTPGASPGTMGDLEGWSFRPSSPCDALSGHPVLERPHRLVEGVPLHRLLPRSPDQPDDLIVRQPHGRRGTGCVVHALEHHGTLELVAPEGPRPLADEW